MEPMIHVAFSPPSTLGTAGSTQPWPNGTTSQATRQKGSTTNKGPMVIRGVGTVAAVSATLRLAVLSRTVPLP